MARGRDKHQAHQAALNALGRTLSRRCKSRCELCEGEGPLRVTEVTGSPEDEPTDDWAALLCDRCKALVQDGRGDPDTLRFLEVSAWSDVAPVQVLAVRALRTLSAHAAWARDTLDGLYLDPEIEERL
jgi:protein PhnA